MLFVSLALAAPPTELEREVRLVADQYDVPAPILMAIAFEATRFNPDAVSQWEGWGMFDLREGDQDPSLEHGAALLGVNPNKVATDWRLSTRAAAAILAEQGRAVYGGALPDERDLLAWWDAVRAFSGRQEPILQDQYTSYIFETINNGYRVDTQWGMVASPPIPLDLTGRLAVPPPTSTDTSLAYQFFSACSDNYSDYSRGAGDIDMIVIHTVQGSYSSCYNWFANCSAEASAHYVVRSSDGQITQMVKEADVAWHAGHWDTNERSIGIEHEGYIEQPSTYYTEAMYQASAALTADIASRQGIPLDRSHIIAHSEVPGCSSGSGGGAGCHTDPGSGWDWDYYMDLINGETGVSDGEIVGVIADSDIYNGTRLVGADVWIAETGQHATTDSSGLYRFADLPFGTYTIHASYAGFAEGTCGPKDHQATQDWCSIALFPSSSGGDGGGDSQSTEDSQPNESAPIEDSAAPPPSTSKVNLPDSVRSLNALGCDSTGLGSVAGLVMIGGLVVSLRRNRG